jgi:hypothetical protein
MTETREQRRERALAEFRAGIAGLRRERDELYARMGGGPPGAFAVAMAACDTDAVTPEVERIAAKYQSWVDEELQKRAAGSADAAP